MAKALAYGGVLVRDDGKVLLRRPKGHFGGYVWTFPKGRPGPGDTPEAAALREVLEETGYRAEIVSQLPGTFGGDVTTTEFFLMRPVGAQVAFDAETAETRWVDFNEAISLISKTSTQKGRERDLVVLKAAEDVLVKANHIARGRGAGPT